MQKRCAYFGCMTPLFTPTDPRQIYCSDECRIKCNNRSKRAVDWQKNRIESMSPEEKKKRAYKSAKANYKRGIIPPFAKD